MPLAKTPPLPDWIECSRAVHADKASALQRFLFDHQPADDAAAKAFRAALSKVLGSHLAAVPDEPQEQAAVPLHWIRLARYCELTGDTAGAVHTRRRKRQWLDGRETKVGPDGNLWVNTAAVNSWIEQA